MLPQLGHPRCGPCANVQIDFLFLFEGAEEKIGAEDGAMSRRPEASPKLPSVCDIWKLKMHVVDSPSEGAAWSSGDAVH